MKRNGNHLSQWEMLLHEMENELSVIQTRDVSAAVKARLCRDLSRDYLLKLQTVRAPFQSPEEEIAYFRDIKPQIYSRYIYYGEQYQLLINDLAISPEVQENYYRKHLTRLKTFLEWHRPFYQYYKSGLDYLDSRYFTRQHTNDDHFVFVDFVDFDTEHSTGFDYLLSKTIAYEQLSAYINERLYQINQPALLPPQPTLYSTPLTWTAPKVALVELIYALYAAGVFNTTQIDIKSIAEAFSHLFAVPLKNIYKIWEEIRLRHKNRTAFIDSLKGHLLRKMDEDDLAAK